METSFRSYLPWLVGLLNVDFREENTTKVQEVHVLIIVSYWKLLNLWIFMYSVLCLNM